MDLRIKDVAELLNVSETTVRRWLSKKIIPAYHINGQYRFSRTEIQDWLVRQKVGETSELPSRSGGQQFSLYRALHRGAVFHNMAAATKEEVIRQTMEKISVEHNLDPDSMAELLLDRENMMPTSLGSGIGVPHTRDFLLSAAYDAVILVTPEEPIEYGALDGEPVHTLFFLFACEDKRHLHLLSKIAHFCSQPESLSFLLQKPSKEELLGYVKQWEAGVKEKVKG